MASAEAEIRHVFGDTPITEASIGAAPPGNNIAQWYQPEEVGQLSREFLDQSNRAIFYASWLRFLSTKFTQDGKNL